MKISYKSILNWTGSALALIGIVFVGIRINQYSTQLDFSRFNELTWFIVTIFALLYGLANILLALAWQNLLEHFGAPIQRLSAIRIYGLTQLAKYVPGNIMHLASRQAMGLAAGLRGWPIAKASVWELGLISITGSFFIILTIPQFLTIITVPIATIGFISIILFFSVAIKRYIGVKTSQAFGLYTMFLSVSGMVFVGLLALVMSESDRGICITLSQVLPFCGAFVIAWLIGLITPGAPAGVGVRELVLMVLLKGIIYESDLVVAVLFSRLVSVGGDVLFFLISSLIQKDSNVNN